MAPSRPAQAAPSPRAADERTPLLSGNGDGESAQQAPLSIPSDVQPNALSGVAASAGAGAKSSSRVVAPDLVRAVLMFYMAVDHAAMTFASWQHGTGQQGEVSDTPITGWNRTSVYVLRTLSHACASGFAMLMGMGIAYWTRSANAKGTSTVTLLRHLALRTLGILILNAVATAKLVVQGNWLINMVLWALAIDYLIVGAFSLLLTRYLEPRLVRLAPRVVPLAIDALLVAASAALIFMNIWVDPTHGRCPALTAPSPAGAPLTPTASVFTEALFVAPPPRPPWETAPPCKADASLIYQFFFGRVMCINFGVVSFFPPMGWISFVVFGLAYGRYMTRSNNSKSAVGINALLAVLFSLLFVSTRIFQYGNLSTGCLHTPEQGAHPSNQFLVGWRSFFYAVKYPPSPSFAFLGLAQTFALLVALQPIAALQRPALVPRIRRVLLVFGTNALFFYAIHLDLFSIVGAIVLQTPLARPIPETGGAPGLPFGLLWWIFYVAVLTACYFMCKAFAAFKAARGPASLWRFF